MQCDSIEFMRELEARFKRETKLADRSFYKIFYGPIHPAKILVLGINPGGDPTKTSPDGRTHTNGAIAAASASYYEGGEHDVLDCDWRENKGLRRLLAPLLNGDVTRIRNEVVKTNLAFRRSAKVGQIEIAAAMAETAPFLSEIIAVVKPVLILLTGVSLSSFTSRFAEEVAVIAPPEKDTRIKQTIFSASRAQLHVLKREVLVVQVAHASQFSWTYERYTIPERIQALLAGSAGVS